MNLNKEFLSEVISYLINRGVTLTDVLDMFNENFNTLNSFSDSLKNMPTDIKRGTINNVIEEPVLPKYTMTESNKVKLESVSLSPEALNKVFDTSKENPLPCRKLKSKSGQMLFDVINGKTVIEHLKENGITYTNFDNRIRKKWSVEKACTTPLASWGKGKRKRVIEKPAETLETESNTENLVTHAKNTTENVTNATELNGNNVTAVILDTPNPDAIREDKNDIIEKALKKFVTHSEESKKDKKPKEVKADLTVLEVCQKMNVTIHELKEMVSTGEFPQPDCDKKWSVKLLKKEGII